MLLKNFFNEVLEFDSLIKFKDELRLETGNNIGIEALEENLETKKRIELLKNEIEIKYKIPKSFQRIFIKNGIPILSVAKRNEKLNKIHCEMPESIREMGATQQDFDYFYNQCNNLEMTQRCLFPYIFKVENKFAKGFTINKYCIFEKIDNYLEQMTTNQKTRILNNLDSYIDSFLE